MLSETSFDLVRPRPVPPVRDANAAFQGLGQFPEGR